MRDQQQRPTPAISPARPKLEARPGEVERPRRAHRPEIVVRHRVSLLDPPREREWDRRSA